MTSCDWITKKLRYLHDLRIFFEKQNDVCMSAELMFDIGDGLFYIQKANEKLGMIMTRYKDFAIPDVILLELYELFSRINRMHTKVCNSLHIESYIF